MIDRARLGRRRDTIRSEPDVSAVHKNAVWQALRWAWEEVRSKHATLVANGREEEISERIQRFLNEHGANGARRVRALSGFETVVRGAKVVTADGRIEKAPDLVFRPIAARGVRNRGDWGFFVECKIIAIDPAHSAKAYCDKGVVKFVLGEYCARMASGGMVAYVRDQRHPLATLAPILDATYRTLVVEPGLDADTCHSEHERGRLPQRCVNIRITHVWLDAS